jgi:hypothetical protein
VEVDLGTTDDHAVVFRGRIHQADADFPQEGVPSLTLHAHDRAMQMGLRPRNRVWQGVRLDQIVRTVSDSHGFASADVRVGGTRSSTATASASRTRPTSPSSCGWRSAGRARCTWRRRTGTSSASCRSAR